MIRQRIVTVILAHNREHQLPLVLAELNHQPTELEEVIVVDNASTDNTRQIAEQNGATVLAEAQRGYGAACQCALEYLDTVLQPNPLILDVVVFLDAGGSDDPLDLPKLVEPILERRAEFVVGSRLLRRESKKAVPFFSRVRNFLAAKCIWLLVGVTFTDIGPFRAITFSALKDLKMKRRRWSWCWRLEMQLKASRLGVYIEEVPVRYRSPR